MQINSIETTSIKQVPRFFMLEESYKLKGNYVSINKCDKGVSGASDNSEYLGKTYSITYANDCSENTLLSDSSNILTTYQKLSTEVLKMAAVGESSVCLPSNLNSEICRKKSVRCQLCDELSSELYKAQQEILSYEKVIQVLREELTNMDQRTHPVGNSRSVLLSATHGVYSLMTNAAAPNQMMGGIRYSSLQGKQKLPRIHHFK